MIVELNEYRCTRSIFYADHDCLGKDDISARSGYYIEAASEFGARMAMAKMFKDDVERAKQLGIDPFTCQFWRKGQVVMRRSCC
jgi:hypothetical protein